MSQWKKIIFCSVMATLNVIPLCFVLWRVGDSIYNINSSEISNELKNVNFQMQDINSYSSKTKYDVIFSTNVLQYVEDLFRQRLQHMCDFAALQAHLLSRCSSKKREFGARVFSASCVHVHQYYLFSNFS